MKVDVVGKLSEKVSPVVGKALLKGKAIAPDVAVYGGLGLVIVGTAWFVKRSINNSEDITLYQDQIDVIHRNRSKMTEKEYRKNLFDVRKDFAVKLTKVYGLPLATVIVGSGGVLYGRHLFKVRNVALMGSNAILQNQLDTITTKVDEVLGGGTAKKFLNNAWEETVTVDTVDENGKKKKVKEKRQYVDYKEPNNFCMFFDEGSPKWSKSSTLNLLAVQSIEQEYTDKLRKRKSFVSLLEVYVDGFKLHIPDDKKRALFSTVGWVYDPNGPNNVSMGVFNNVGDAKINFVNGYESVLLLDPNIDGDILSVVEMRKGA